MRFCIIGPSKYFFSGITVHTILLANAMSKNGNDVSVVLLRKLLPRAFYPGLQHVGKNNYLIDLEREVTVFEGIDWYSPVSWLKAYHFYRKQQPNATIMLWWSSSVAYMQLFLALLNKFTTKAKLILEMHEMIDPLEDKILPIRIYSRIMCKLVVKTADAVTVHSEDAKEKLSQRYQIDTNKIFVKPFGIYECYGTITDKESTRKELNIKEEFVILNLGLIRKYKGLPDLVKAFSLLPEPIAKNSRLIVAGEKWENDDQLESLIIASCYKDKITYSPHYVPDEMIPKYFSAADVVVLPYTRTFGSGIASIAIANKKIIISTELKTMKELLRDYENAFFVPVNNAIAIKEKLIEIYNKIGLVQKKDTTPYDNTWEKISELYKDLAK